MNKTKYTYYPENTLINSQSEEYRTYFLGMEHKHEATTNTRKNYYTFGMLMPGRNFNTTTYRYGFNGKEKDDELKASGNSYD
ncbi:MAG: hypothetical protein WC223_11855, partial [Bacteroidales bacterium]